MPTAMLKQLSSQYIAPALKSAGFTKHGLIWNRRIDRLVHVFRVEETRWSGEDESDFGVNIGVAVPEVHRVVWGEELPRVVRESDCLPRFPYGYLPGVEVGRNIGWKLHGPADIEQVGPDVMRAIREKCLPVLIRCQSVQDVQKLADGVEQWKQPAERLKFTVLSCLAGQDESWETVLNDMESNPRLTAWKARISETRDRLREYLAGQAVGRTDTGSPPSDS